MNTPSLQFIMDANAADGSFADAIDRDPQAVTGRILAASRRSGRRPRNLSFQRMSGMDFRGDFRIPTDNLGDFTARIGATYLNDVKIQEQPGEEIINVLADATLAELVRFRGTAEVGWSPRQSTAPTCS